jgi:hypothetical protein
MISLLLAASAVIATPANLSRVLKPDDYPAWQLDRDASAAALVDVLVEPSGHVNRCTVEETFGTTNLALEICKIVMGKRVTPARGFDGRETYGRVRTLLRLFLPDTREGAMVAKLRKAADVILTVKHLPGGVKAAEVGVLLAVDGAGRVTNCQPSSALNRKDMVDAICSARDALGAGKVADRLGKAVSHLVVKTVELRVDDTPGRQN